jgi:hypothetical protein
VFGERRDRGKTTRAFVWEGNTVGGD